MVLSTRELQRMQLAYRGRRTGFRAFAATAENVINVRFLGSCRRDDADLTFELFGESFRLRMRFRPRASVDRVDLQKYCDDGSGLWIEVSSAECDLRHDSEEINDPVIGSEYQEGVEAVLLKLISDYVESTPEDAGA